MSAIQGIRGVLEIKVDSVATEVTLLLADFRKISDQISENKSAITTLQAENQTLKQRVLELQRSTTAHESKLDDLEGRSRRNNIRITGVPEKAEGAAEDLFVEDLVLKGLRPHGLSAFFSVEREHRI